MGLCSSAMAHPPKDVELSFNDATKVLMIHVSHAVGNIEKHFIDRVIVKLNKKIVVDQAFDVQDTNEGQSFQYEIPQAKLGDKIIVKAACNVFGKKKGAIIVE